MMIKNYSIKPKFLVFFLLNFIFHAFVYAQAYWSDPQIIPTIEPHELSFADFDNDGDEDMLILNYNHSSMTIVFNDGNGSFQNSDTIQTYAYPRTPTIADFNNDGNLDFAQTHSSGYNSGDEITVHLGKGDGTFHPYQLYSSLYGSFCYYADAADINGDSFVDIAFTSAGSPDGFGLLINNGDGTFTEGNNYPAGRETGRIILEDINNDGIIDASLGCGAYGSGYQLDVYFGNGDATFSNRTTYPSPISGSRVQLHDGADLDGDNDFDLIASIQKTNNRNLYILRNDGTGSFSYELIETGGWSWGNLTDWNNDNFPDIVDNKYNDQIGEVTETAVFINNGSGNFSEKIILNENHDRYYLPSDLNNDGLIDIAGCRNTHDSVYVYWQEENSSCLLAYYPFNDYATDESGNGNDGTVNGAILTTDRFGNENSAYSFDGDDDYITSENLLLSNVFSISAWINPASLDENVMMFVEQHQAGTNNGFWFATHLDSLKSRNTTVFANFQENSWYHAVYICNNGNEKLYLDGDLLIENNIAPILNHTDQNLYIGNDNQNDYQFNGNVDDIHIYNCAIDEETIDSLYNIGGWPNEQDCLVAHYPFNGNANDESGNGNDGAVNGATLTTDRFGNENSAYSFDGQSNIEISHNQVLSLQNELSLSFWFKGNDNSNIQKYFISKWDETNGEISWFADIADNSGIGSGIDFYISKDGNSGSETSRIYRREVGYNYQDELWHHYAAVFSPGETISLYIDNQIIGIVEGNIQEITEIYQNDHNLTVGKSHLGEIDDIHIFECAIDEETIDSLYHIGGWPYLLNSPLVTGANICGPGVAALIASGSGNGVNYKWYQEFDDTEELYTGAEYTTPFLNEADTFYVQADSAGMLSIRIEVVVNVHPVPSFTYTQANILCYGDSSGLIDILASDGTPNYNYSIDDGVNWSDNHLYTDLEAGDYHVMVKDVNECSYSEIVSLTEPEAELSFSTSITNILCQGESTGEIEIFSSGGTPAYDFSIDSGNNWQTSNIFDQLYADDYEVFIKDANDCLSFETISLMEPIEALGFTENISNINCFGDDDGIIEINAFGGTPVYEFSIDNGVNYTADSIFENLSPGIYNLFVKDNHDCVDSLEIILTQPDEPLAADITTQEVLCFGDQNGTIEFEASGGTPFYEFSINGGISFQTGVLFVGLHGGNYTCITRDANLCSDTSIISLIEPDEQLSFELSLQDPTCFGEANGYAKVITEGGTPDYEFSLDEINWQTNNSFENLGDGEYQIFVKDINDCSVSSGFVLTEPTELEFTTSTNNITCFGGADGEIIVLANGGTPSYQYSIDGGTTYQTSNTFTDLLAGNYSVVVLDNNACQTQHTITLTQPSSLPEVYFTGLASSYCTNDEVVLLEGNQAPLGNFSGAGIFDNGNGTAYFDPAEVGSGGTNEIIYYYTDADGCYNEEIQETMIHQITPVEIIGLLQFYCEDAELVYLTGSETPEGNFYGPGITDLGNGMATFSPSDAGVGGPHTISYAYTNEFGCLSSSDTVTMVNPLPELSIDNLSASYCVDEEGIMLTGNPLGGSFSGNGITDLGDGTAAFNPSEAGVGAHEITYSYMDGNFCSNSISMPTEVLNYVNLSISGLSSSYCESSEPVLITGSMAPEGVFSGDGIIDNGDGTAYFNPSNLESGNTYIITYDVNETGICAHSAVQSVGIVESVAVSFQGLASYYCESALSTELTGSQAPDGWFEGEGITDNGDGTARLDLQQMMAGENYTVSYYYDNGGSNCISQYSASTEFRTDPTANFTNLLGACGDGVGFIDLSTSENGSIVGWDWDFGDPLSGLNNNSTEENPIHQYVSNLDYFTVGLEVEDEIGCRGSIVKIIEPYPNAEIHGHVFKSNGDAIEEGYVVAFYLSNGYLSVIADIADIQPDGSYEFTSLSSCVDYLIHAVPDITAYPFYFPRWYENAFFWYDGQAISPTNEEPIIENIDFYLNAQPPLPTGPNSISGGVYYVDAKGEPVKNVDVILEYDAPDDKNTIIGDYVYSDDEGLWTFEGLPEGSFRVKVDIPGLMMDSVYHIEITEPETHLTGYNYYVDTLSGIYIIYTGLEEVSTDYQISVIPNPNKGNFIVQLVDEKSPLRVDELEILDLRGRIIEIRKPHYYGDQYEENINIQGIESGVYLLRLRTDQGEILRKIVINK